MRSGHHPAGQNFHMADTNDAGGWEEEPCTVDIGTHDEWWDFWFAETVVLM
jgi:hypothetical protein